MRAIYEGAETYGEGSSSEQASQFWFDHLLEGVVERAREASDLPGSVDYLVSLVGFSPATTVVNYRLLEPNRVLLICTENAHSNVNTIHHHLVDQGDISPAGFSHETVQPYSATDIYEQVRRKVDRDDLTGEGEGPRAIIDITGGKKVMSATAALAAWQLDLQLCYLDSTDYDPDMRRPVPGTEVLRILDNPTALFGDQAMETATSVFNTGAYNSAETQFEQLADRLANPNQARFMRALSGMYRAWCDLNFDDLPDAADGVKSRMSNPYVELSSRERERLTAQVNFLRSLSADNRLEMLLSHRLLASHYADQNRHDFATLLYYRTMEGCFDVQFARCYDGFDTGAPNYELLGPPVEEIETSFNEVAAEVFDDYRQSGLPSKIGFMSAAFLLHILDDRLLKELDLDKPRDLQFLRRLADVRNQSVLAHGFDRITESDSEDLRRQSRRFLTALWRIHRPDEDFAAKFDRLKFVRFQR